MNTFLKLIMSGDVRRQRQTTRIGEGDGRSLQATKRACMCEKDKCRERGRETERASPKERSCESERASFQASAAARARLAGPDRA